MFLEVVMDFSQEWVWRLMEIRRNPSIATSDDILKMADEIFYRFYTERVNGSQQADVSKNIIQLVENIS